MTTVYDSLVDDCVYFDTIKRRDTFLKYVKFTESLDVANLVSFINSTSFTNSTSCTISALFTSSVSSVNFTNSICSMSSVLSINSILSASSVPFTSSVFFMKSFLRKLYLLKRYNKEMNDLDNHTKQNSFYTTSRHHCRRNWFSLFFFLIDTVVINVYILYKLVNKDRENRNNRRIKILLHIEFQEEITKNLFYRPRAILRQRRSRPFQKSCVLHTKSIRKDSYKEHS